MLLAPPHSHTTPIWPQAHWDQFEGKIPFRIWWILEKTSMFSDTMWAWMGFCHAPTISPTAPFVARLTQPAQTTWAISGTECSVHCALFGASGLLSTSVPLHLQTTIGHQEAPQRPQYYPKGIVGNLALRNKWGFYRNIVTRIST